MTKNSYQYMKKSGKFLRILESSSRMQESKDSATINEFIRILIAVYVTCVKFSHFLWHIITHIYEMGGGSLYLGLYYNVLNNIQNYITASQLGKFHNKCHIH